MYIIAPASEMTLSCGSSSISTNCISLPKIVYSISCASLPEEGGGACIVGPAFNSSTLPAGCQSANPSRQTIVASLYWPDARPLKTIWVVKGPRDLPSTATNQFDMKHLNFCLLYTSDAADE